MARSKPGPPSPYVSLRLDDDLFAAVVDHMRVANHSTMQSAVRELLWMTLASHPYSGVLRAAREEVLTQYSRWIHNQLEHLIGEMKDHIHEAEGYLVGGPMEAPNGNPG